MSAVPDEVNDKHADAARVLWESLRNTDFHDGRNRIARFRREAVAEAYLDAAERSEKERVMFLTKDNVADGMLRDDHPVIVARRMMRSEIAKELREVAASLVGEPCITHSCGHCGDCFRCRSQVCPPTPDPHAIPCGKCGDPEHNQLECQAAEPKR